MDVVLTIPISGLNRRELPLGGANAGSIFTILRLALTMKYNLGAISMAIKETGWVSLKRIELI